MRTERGCVRSTSRSGFAQASVLELFPSLHPGVRAAAHRAALLTGSFVSSAMTSGRRRTWPHLHSPGSTQPLSGSYRQPF
jgi:hypothetical protein